MKRTAIPATVTLAEYDAGLHERFSKEASQLAAIQRQEKTAEWFDEHDEYLRTSKWRDKRDRVLKRDFYLCQACLRRKATQVHHKTYEHWKDEPLFDLISMCDECHDHLTNIDRERRG